MCKFMLSLRGIRRSLHIGKIHESNNSFFIIPTLPSKSYFYRHYSYVRSRRKENSSEIHQCSWNLSKCKTFSPANQINRNRHNVYFPSIRVIKIHDRFSNLSKVKRDYLRLHRTFGMVVFVPFYGLKEL